MARPASPERRDLLPDPSDDHPFVRGVHASHPSTSSSIPIWRSLSSGHRRLALLALASLTLLLLFYRPSLLHSCPSRPPSNHPPSILPLSSFPSSILITGGAGYIGSHMSLLLFEQDHPFTVVIVDDLSRGDRRNVDTLQALSRPGWSYHFEEMDCGDTERVAQLLQQHRVELVIHFAGFAYASESVQHPLRYFDNIVTKTQHLLAAMEQAGVHRLVYSSSSATYGQPLDPDCDVPIAENTPQVPVSPYGRSKLMAEQVIEAYQVSQHRAGKPFSFAALRYFNVIGADVQGRVGPMPKAHLKEWSRVVDACFDAVIDDNAMRVYGADYATPDGTAIRDYIHVQDLVRAHLGVISVVHDDSHLAYNVGIGHGFSNNQLVEACGEATGRKVKVQVEPRRVGDPALVLGDATRIRTELAWKPEHTVLSEMIRTAWVWRQKWDQLKATEGQAA